MRDRKLPYVWIAVLAGVACLVVALWRPWAGAESDAGSDSVRGSSTSDHDDAPLRVDPRARRFELEGADKAAVSGTIRDEGAHAIAGARVCAYPDAAAMRGLGDSEAPRCTLSEADGHYRLEQLWPTPTQIHASAPRFVPARWEREGAGPRREQLKLSPGQSAEGVDVVLRGGGVPVRGVVRDISGGEIEGAQVRAEGRSRIAWRGMASAVSDEQGRFELWTAPGRLTVLARVEGYAPGGVRAVAPGEFVELFLTPESVLVGRVVHALSREPIAGVEVQASSRWPGQHRVTRTNELGEFRIAELEPGAYKPAVLGDTLVGEAAALVHLGLGQTSEPVELLAHDAALVTGSIVVAGAAEPCRDGEVMIEGSAEGTRKRAETDDEGQVELRGVLPGSYRVVVSCEGYVSEPSYPELVVGADPGAAEGLVGLVWEVREGLAIRGELIDERGASLTDVRVRVSMVVDRSASREQATGGTTTSEADGSFAVAGLLPGTYEVKGGGGRDWRPGPADPVRVTLEPGADVNDVRIVMPSSGQLRGRVVDELGQPAAGESVEADQLGLSESTRARTDDEGRFVFDHLRVGSVRVRVRADFGRGTVRAPGTSDDDVQGEVVEIRANEVAEVELLIEGRDGVIRGRVVDEGGAPVIDAFVDAARMSERAGADASRTRIAMRWSWGRQPVLTDQDGRFELDGLAAGRHMVRAHRKGGGEALAEGVELGAEVELEITATGELGGSVSFAAGGPAPERFTVLVRDGAQGVWLGDIFFRTRGRWRIPEVPAGSYEITVDCPGGGAVEEVALSEGEVRDDIEVVLDSTVTVRGRVVDLDSGEPLAGFEVGARAASGRRRRRADDVKLNITLADGRFEIVDVPPGRVSISGRMRGPKSAREYDTLFTVRDIAVTPASQDIGDIQAIARRRGGGDDPGDLGYTTVENDRLGDPREQDIEVARVRPGGPAQAAGLEPGDVIVKVDGHDVVGDPSRYRALVGVGAGQGIRLGLEGGGSAEIVAGPPR